VSWSLKVRSAQTALSPLLRAYVDRCTLSSLCEWTQCPEPPPLSPSLCFLVHGLDIPPLPLCCCCVKGGEEAFIKGLVHDSSVLQTRVSSQDMGLGVCSVLCSVCWCTVHGDRQDLHPCTVRAGYPVMPAHVMARAGDMVQHNGWQEVHGWPSSCGPAGVFAPPTACKHRGMRGFWGFPTCDSIGLVSQGASCCVVVRWQAHGVTCIRTTQLFQGFTVRWAVAWSFFPASFFSPWQADKDAEPIQRVFTVDGAQGCLGALVQGHHVCVVCGFFLV
jgi:hypothetical protein